VPVSLGGIARSLGLLRRRRLAGRLIFPEDHLYSVWQEEHLARLFADLRVDCVFDVGANEGQFAKLLRHRLEYKGLIISFEPVPELADYLRSEAANDPNWHIEEIALGDESGETIFNVMNVSEFSSLGTPSHEDSGLFRSLNDVSETITVQAETLATSLQRLQGRHNFCRPFLKLDTQGMDVPIATADPDALRQFVALQAELAVKRLYRESVGMTTALRAYADCGFEPAIFLGMNPSHFPLLVEVDCLLVREDLLPDEELPDG